MNHPASGLVDVLLDSASSFLHRGELEDAQRCILHALSAAREDPAWRGRALLLSGQIARAQSRLEDAELNWREALELQRASEDLLSAAETLCDLGELSRRRGRFPEALAAIRESLQLSSGETPGTLRARALEEFGMLQRQLGAPEESMRAFTEAVRIREAIDDRPGLARACRGLGNVCFKLGFLDQALDAHQRSFEIYETLERREDGATALNNIGTVQIQLGRNAEAEENFRRARTIFEQLGHRDMMAYAATNLGVLAAYRGDAAEAETHLREALAIREEMGNLAGQAKCLNNLANVSHMAGRYEDAIGWADRSIRALTEVERMEGLTAAWFARGRACLELGRVTEAEAARRELSTVAERAGNREGQCDALLLETELAIRREAFREALLLAERARVAADNPRHAAEALRLQGETQLALHSNEAAREALLESERAFRELQSPYYLALCRLTLGRLFSNAGSLEAGAERLRRAEEAFATMGNGLLRWRCLHALAAAEWPISRRQARRTLARATEVARIHGRPDLIEETKRLGEDLAAEGVDSALSSAVSGLASLAQSLRQAADLEAAVGEALDALLELFEVDAVFVIMGDGPDPPSIDVRPLHALLPAGIEEMYGRVQLSGLETQWFEPQRTARRFAAIARIPPSGSSNRAALGVIGQEEPGRESALASVASLLQVTAGILGLAFDLVARVSEEVAFSSEIDELEPGIVGRSQLLRSVLHTVAKVAPLDSSVLLQGESGTGKELIARALHRRSSRSQGPFEAISCPSIPRDLIEAEFFGHEKGAFTGADRERPGRFELADGGTLFLDEIGDIELGTQSKLLRVLQEREFQRVGGRHAIRVDVRVIAATSRDLEAEMRAGRFREDLFYRLSVVPIAMPPLRERGEDVLLLADRFLHELAVKAGTAPVRLAADAREILLRYAWPGNIRELRNLLEYLVAMNREGRITASDLPSRLREAAEAAPDPRDAESARLLKPGETLDARLMAVEGQLIRRALVLSGWNQSQAARLLGVTETRMRHRMRRYGAQPQDPPVRRKPGGGR